MPLTPHLSLLLLLLLLLLSLASFVAPTAYSAPPPLPTDNNNNNNTSFIRSRCRATLYPALCYTSLAAFSPAINQSPAELARVAANLTAARVAALAGHVARLRRARPASDAASALRDCSEALADAADQSRRSAGELRGIDAAVGPEVAWRVSNVQTWMSAALTNEDTCEEGFGDVAVGSRARADVCRRVRRVKEYTSNALALVNGLVNGR